MNQDSLMLGPAVLARTLSAAALKDKHGNVWQYLSRGDHHSKVACWCIVTDLLRECALLRQHVSANMVAFGINHEMRDFQHDRKKKLDLVICRPLGTTSPSLTLKSMIGNYSIVLTESERANFDALPEIRRAPVGAVLIALEAKACMTAHQRALPRLYDELNSSHLTVHGATDEAIAAGFVMVNVSARYLSPDLNKENRKRKPKWSEHNQPRDAQLAIDKARQLPRRTKTGDNGYDALGISVIDCMNDGSPVSLVTFPPAPSAGDIYEYGAMILRMSHIYSTRFKQLDRRRTTRVGFLS